MSAADEIFERIDAVLAVDRALNMAEEGVFLEHLLVGSYEGARPADWIGDAEDADVFQAEIGSWWEEYGDKALAVLMAVHELPEPLVRRLLNAALVAMFATAGKLPTDRRETHIELAGRAALWARGYAEALGWAPPRRA